MRHPIAFITLIAAASIAAGFVITRSIQHVGAADEAAARVGQAASSGPSSSRPTASGRARRSASAPASRPTADPIEALLAELGLEARNVGVRRSDLLFMLGDRPRSHFVELMMTEPLRADGFARVLTANVLQSVEQDNLPRVLQQMSQLNSHTLYRGLLGDPTAALQKSAGEPRAMYAMLVELGADDAHARAADRLPGSVQHAAALLLGAAHDAVPWIDRALMAGDSLLWEQFEARLKLPLRTGPQEDEWDKANPDPDYELELKRAVERFETSLVLAAAQDMLYATRAAVKLLAEDASLAKAAVDFEIPTELGWVVIRGGGDDVHDDSRPTLLLIDLGGNDTYAAAGATHDRIYPLSVAIDVAGRDAYRASRESACSFGAGIMGVGLLWDGGGEDTYDAPRRGLGCGQFGVGVVVDWSGDDTYRSIDAAQGSALAGYGLLLDREGKDAYESYRSSQGSAGPNACAMLVDLAGDDAYVANDTDIRYPSPQTKEHNTSMSQGAATGWRNDYTDAVSVCGGVGVLLDAGGRDKYSCGLFGQGAGYWNGCGLLIDRGGDDEYRGVWYVQGAAAHYAAGLLLDREGDDRYEASHNMSQGAGHDLSAGVFIDDAGDDLYRATTLGLGASNAAGFGLFVDRSGEDRYEAPPQSDLGWVNAPDGYRALFPAQGLFFDLGGRDAYVLRDGDGAPRDGVGDSRRWRQATSELIGACGFDE